MSISKMVRFKILERDGFRCRYCGAKAPETPLEVDHIHPVAAGGVDHESNLVTACEPCNAGKRDRVMSGQEESLSLKVLEERRILAILREIDASVAEYRGAIVVRWCTMMATRRGVDSQLLNELVAMCRKDGPAAVFSMVELFTATHGMDERLIFRLLHANLCQGKASLYLERSRS